MIHPTIKRKQRGPSRTEGSRCFRCVVCKEKIGGNGKISGRLFQGGGCLCRAAGSIALQPSRQHKGHGAQCGAQDKDDVKAAGQVVQVGETGAGKREHQAADVDIQEIPDPTESVAVSVPEPTAAPTPIPTATPAEEPTPEPAETPAPVETSAPEEGSGDMITINLHCSDGSEAIDYASGEYLHVVVLHNPNTFDWIDVELTADNDWTATVEYPADQFFYINAYPAYPGENGEEQTGPLLSSITPSTSTDADPSTGNSGLPAGTVVDVELKVNG